MTDTHRKRKAVIDRLSRIEGHVGGIKRMIEEDRSCASLIIQVAAVQAALKKVGLILIEDHLETCMVEAVRTGNYQAEYQELKEALSQFL